MLTITRVAKVLNGKYTIQNRDTGSHRTFRIKTQKSDAIFAPGKRIVSVMNGNDNQNHYKGFAFIDDDGIHLWRRYQNDPIYRGYAFMFWNMINGPDHILHQRYTIEESLNCIRCNRELTTPESLASGIGPVCEGRI